MPDVPDLYADQFTMVHSPWGVTFNFGLSLSNPPAITGQQAPSQPQAVIRMSLEHAKVMAMIIRKQLKQYELEHLGDPINVPAAVLQAMKLDQNYW